MFSLPLLTITEYIAIDHFFSQQERQKKKEVQLLLENLRGQIRVYCRVKPVDEDVQIDSNSDTESIEQPITQSKVSEKKSSENCTSFQKFCIDVPDPRFFFPH